MSEAKLGTEELPIILMWNCIKQGSAKLPRRAIFVELRRMWLNDVEPKRKVGDLAEMLGERITKVSSWSTGNDGYSPPWWAINRLLLELGRELRITPRGVTIKRQGRDDGPMGRHGKVCRIAWDTQT